MVSQPTPHCAGYSTGRLHDKTLPQEWPTSRAMLDCISNQYLRAVTELIEPMLQQKYACMLHQAGHADMCACVC